MKFHSRFNLGPRVSLDCGKVSRTKQSFRDECDINRIMAKFIKTGSIDHLRKHGGSYGDATSVDFHEAMNVITSAEQMFGELPSAIRVRFNDDPAEFLDFVGDDANLEEMRDLGLAHKLAAVPGPVEPGVVPAVPPVPVPLEPAAPAVTPEGV